MTVFKEYIVRVDSFVPDAIYERSLEEVVRCLDCKAFVPSGYCAEMHHKALADGFCAWAVRRSE